MNGEIIRRVSGMLFLMAIVMCCSTVAFANKSEKLWQKAAESSFQPRGERKLFPEKYATFKLDAVALRGEMAEMPLEFSIASKGTPTIIEIPMPDGTTSRFRIEESTVLADHLRKDFPTWKTFRGYGIDDARATAQFDWTSKGFHGYVFTSKGTVYIDPFQENDTENYLVYYKHEFGRPQADDFSCSTGDGFSGAFGLSNLDIENASFAPSFANGTNIRTYRIAIATTGEWARGTTASIDPITVRTAALAALTTSVNRLDGIFRIELAISLQLVNPSINNNATNIIFDDPATDPYDNTDSKAQLPINHTTITNRVGTPNFDVGHLYGTGGGGVAQTPSVCDNTDKGQGYSARAGFYGDPFTVDYAAHEIGHQFSAGHTYNNSTVGGACTTRSATEAFEVASGVTLMSYVGICSTRNLQQYVDTSIPAFHISSLSKILNYVQTGTGNTCGSAGPNNNAIPTVNAGASFTIPRLTPFTLTATGNDADAGDVANLLYSWEQFDLAPSPSGPVGIPVDTYDVDTDGVLRPLFRVYSPISSPSRTYPSLNFILNPNGNSPAGSNNPALTYTGTHPTGAAGAICDIGVTCVIGESLPSVTRTMNFRVSLRDRRGGMVDSATTVAVAGAAGPFRVASPNFAELGGTSWQGGSTQTVTWDVAGTTANGINAANVKISLSTDGGQTFPLTLAASTPNDGTQAIVVPNNATTQARIKVEAVGNIFFDISNVNFGITAVAGKARADFDADGRTDLSVFRPSENNWYLNRSTAGFSVSNFGATSDVIVPADYDGDRRTDLAVWRPTNVDGQPDFFVLRSTDSTVSGIAWGVVNDVPVIADYDGDGKADFAVWRPTTGDFYVLQSQSGGLRHYRFGVTGDKPVSADYDGDGKADFAVFRPSNGTWYIARSIDNAVIINPWGISTDIPVFADYDGDSKDDLAVFRPSNGTWYIQKSTGGISYIRFGTNGDVPVPGDYDGDGKNDQAVYRGGTWFLNRSTSGFATQAFGLGSDTAVPSAYHP